MALANSTNLPATIPSEQEAALSYKLSTNAATLCGAIVKSTAVNIQGRRYVRSEGWLAIAMAHGCVVSVRSVEQIEGGICAIAELRRMSDQSLIATAEGFVGDDEKMWAGRPMFARRAMAQTRASSRVCRTVFAFVVVMIDKDLGTTPAEEMHGVVDYEPTNGGNAQARSLQVDPADQGMVQGDGRSQYQVDKEKKAKANAVATLKASAKLAIGLCHDRLALKEWWMKHKPALEEGLTAIEFDKVVEMVDARWDELPAPEKVG